ncbi:Papain-like cysteine peptidase superfamily [Arabidopsis suecica]|uniref:Papain-like cysteine peptidase superfamily n=1 Tax=Arabidopsis suecica TaxID=45249 RepID=A0A8T2DGR9_ARASU|nr:Papain-like cysteine peptidase superfamily [Arabidopsis suecica]
MVERVITMLKKKVVTDQEIRLRYACLALVDGFLLLTSHYPKIMKDHAEMAEDLQWFLKYPWGRLSFEMMTTSIKEREVEQLATTCITVQGFLYALQLVVLEAAPVIQEGPQIDEIVGSDSDVDSTVVVGPRQGVALKLGNAKDVDAKCEMAEEGKAFSNEMFGGGCIPSEVVVAVKKPKRGGKAKVVRGRKGTKTGRNTVGLRRKQKIPGVDEREGFDCLDANALSRMLDDKLKAQEKRIIEGGDSNMGDDTNTGVGGQSDAEIADNTATVVDVQSDAEITDNTATVVDVQSDAEIADNTATVVDVQSDAEITDNTATLVDVQDMNRPSATRVSEHTPEDSNVHPLSYVSIEELLVGVEPTPQRGQVEGNDDFPLHSSQLQSRASEEPLADVSKVASSQIGDVAARETSLSPTHRDSDEDFTTPPPSNPSATKAAIGTVPDVEKTKLLVGHPSPLLSVGEVVTDPEERYQRSLSKIRGKSFISIVGEVSLSAKKIFDIIERKKQFTSKVMDALLFSRHLLRTDDIDGEKLRVDVLGSKFVSQVTRLFLKFSKTSPPKDFIFPAVLVELLMGVGEADRVRLFDEASFVYMPFNFDKKHWVALCVDLKAHKITTLDSNIQLRKDSAMCAELQPLAAMLPYLFKQANSSGDPISLHPFSIDCLHGIPQVTSSFDSGVFSVFLIHAHAAGGIEECVNFDVAALDQEAKKLVSTIILAGVAS